MRRTDTRTMTGAFVYVVRTEGCRCCCSDCREFSRGLASQRMIDRYCGSIRLVGASVPTFFQVCLMLSSCRCGFAILPPSSQDGRLSHFSSINDPGTQRRTEAGQAAYTAYTSTRQDGSSTHKDHKAGLQGHVRLFRAEGAMFKHADLNWAT